MPVLKLALTSHASVTSGAFTHSLWCLAAVRSLVAQLQVGVSKYRVIPL